MPEYHCGGCFVVYHADMVSRMRAFLAEEKHMQTAEQCSGRIY